MRLTCPNCGAQYEVPDEVIPTTGRDVQCSNCGDTWFQYHPDHEPDPAEEDVQETELDTPEPETPVEEEQVEEAKEEQSAETQPESVEEKEEVADASEETDEDHTDDDEDHTDDDVNESESAERRELDPGITEVLREEAERESAARASESGGLETQPELGLSERPDDAERRSAEAQARMARLRGETEEDSAEEDEDEGPDPGTRRNLLPDIDEINSSLDSDSSDPAAVHPSDAAEVAGAKQPGGFRRGFRTIILLALLGFVLYVFAPQISTTIPAVEGPLESYVQMVDGVRIWFHEMVDGMLNSSEQ